MATFLVGDIGGTNSRLGLWRNGSLEGIKQFRNTDQATAEKQYGDYLEEAGPVDGACFGIAGPAFNGRVHMTNLGWTFEESALSALFGCPTRCINDFHAQALAMHHIPSEQLHTLQTASSEASKHAAVIGAGTGLGEALLAWGGDRYHVLSGEGSHGRFAPKSEREFEVLKSMMAKWPDHVSVERVASGPGLAAVYHILFGEKFETGGSSPLDPAQVTERALAGDEKALEVMKIFISTLADEAASLTLKCNAGTTYLSGGIPPRILPLLDEFFIPSFLSKGRYRSQMEKTTVHVVTYPHAGLLGAGYGASEMFTSS